MKVNLKSGKLEVYSGNGHRNRHAEIVKRGRRASRRFVRGQR